MCPACRGIPTLVPLPEAHFLPSFLNIAISLAFGRHSMGNLLQHHVSSVLLPLEVKGPSTRIGSLTVENQRICPYHA